jgi:hypothetical protein
MDVDFERAVIESRIEDYRYHIAFAQLRRRNRLVLALVIGKQPEKIDAARTSHGAPYEIILARKYGRFSKTLVGPHGKDQHASALFLYTDDLAAHGKQLPGGGRILPVSRGLRLEESERQQQAELYCEGSHSGLLPLTGDD